MPQATRSRAAERPRRVISYEQVVGGARLQFLREGSVNMEKLAAELAVSRATIYRLVEGRDRLLGDVLWSLSEPMLERIAQSVPSKGVDAIIDITMRFHESILRAEPFLRFLEAEPSTAVRVLFSPAGRVHERAIRMQARIFAAIRDRDGIELPEDLDCLAYLYVRVAESLLYGEVLSGRTPDLRLVERAARAMLTAR